MQDIIVGTWGIGPVHRRRVKLHIEEAIKLVYIIYELSGPIDILAQRHYNTQWKMEQQFM